MERETERKYILGWASDKGLGQGESIEHIWKKIMNNLV